MNTQLVDSIIQVVKALPQLERQALLNQLHRDLDPSTQPTDQDSNPEDAGDESAWAIWQTLGDDASTGRLTNPSINHDQYLYSKPQ